MTAAPPGDRDPNWRDAPAALEALCDRGAELLHRATSPDRDTTTLEPPEEYL
ncbi:hypothetical protein [Streptomyces aureus]|uniref:hypothetical protein n=1 Tax=Streptomyces aureus TaxID=193461 RepID=UPI000AA1C834|nr:hypothetical protein [Streptomyces aureus]